LQFYTRLGPGAGFFPFWLAVVFGILSVLMFRDAVSKPRQALPADFFPSRTGLVRIVGILLGLAVVALVLEPLGFRLTMLLFYLTLLYLLGTRNAIVAMLVALAGSFGVHHVFVHLLKVPLPVGLFGI
jgi:putative tricarboxylic transport membrane protein